MAQIIRFPVSATKEQTGKPDLSLLIKSAAAVAVLSGLDKRTAAAALRRVASALERRG